MISLTTIFFIIGVHYIADFVFQTRKQALQKSTSNKYLFYHVGVYSLTWLLAMWGYSGCWEMAVDFATITFVAHFITDYLTSRCSKHFFSKQDYHNGFVVVGFDQILHYVQLFLAYDFLFNYFEL